MPENFVRALTYKPFGICFRNTILVAGLNVIAVVFTSSFCAYGFARMRFPGRDFWFGIASFRSQTDISWDLQLAASTAVTLPVIALFFLAQRYFIQAVVMTGLKG